MHELNVVMTYFDSMDEHAAIHRFPPCRFRNVYAAGQAEGRPVYGAG